LIWSLTVLVWWAGGWLIATHAFQLEKRARLITGLAVGLICYLWIINILGRWVAPEVTFPGAAFLVLFLGLGLARGRTGPLFDKRDFEAWPQLIGGLILALFFARLGKGLGIFSDFMNLSIISTMAAGDIPPQFYMNSSIDFVYHYGFQLLGSSMMQLGGMFPWSAFDLSKGLAWGIGVLLVFPLARRYSPHPLAGITAALVLIFASGTRYLALLLPPEFLLELDSLIQLQGTSAGLQSTFSASLGQGWSIDGGPPLPYPFVFLNGLNPPLILAHGGPSILSLILLLLLWLLIPRTTHRFAWIPLTLLISFWGLTWETSYGLFLFGYAVLWLIDRFRKGEPGDSGITALLPAVALSIPIVLFQGGTITEFGEKIFFTLAGLNPGSGTPGGDIGFTLRWPPGIASAHLGTLEIFKPREFAIALLEIGPIILFTPWIYAWSRARKRQDDWFPSLLALSAGFGFLLPIFIAYTADQDISRLTQHALIVWTLILVISLWSEAPSWNESVRTAAVVGLGLMVFGGVVVTGIQLTAAARPVLTFGFTGEDARIARNHWDKLSPESEIFDPKVWRATALTGLLTRAASENDTKTPLPAWQALKVSPTVPAMLANGFRYVYVDEKWWTEIPEAGQESLSAPCVQVLSEFWDGDQEGFRRLLDLNECQPDFEHQ
jgi:hypothetical protein